MNDIEQVLAELKALRKDLGELDKKLTVHAALDEQNKKTLSEHNRILKGVNGTPGLVSKVDKNTTELGKIARTVDKVMTPILYAVGGGIIFLIILGAIGLAQ